MCKVSIRLTSSGIEPISSLLINLNHRYRAENDDYSAIMLKAVADRLAEVCIISKC